MIRFETDLRTGPEWALGKEWLETNGIGGFASSTVIGLNTRRYHGLLTAALRPPVGRFVLFSKLEETAVVGNERFELSCNEYPGTFHPNGYTYLRDFRLDPFPTFTYSLPGVLIQKQVFLVQGENTVVVQYVADHSCSLDLRPLIAFRDYHLLTHQNTALNSDLQVDENLVAIRPYADLPTLFFTHQAESVEKTGIWYFNFQYRVEQERGLDHQEDLFNPFLLRLKLDAGIAASLIASTRPRNLEFQRPRRVTESGFAEALTSRAHQFIVRRGHLETILAGYHWFTDWGRDTMIALPGLTLATGHIETAKRILVAFARAVDQGMLPNRWPDAGETPEYNTVDATLWFFEAAGALMRQTHDAAWLNSELISTLQDIIRWHIRGTRYGIHVRDDGLLASGEPGSNLTWMDARVNNIPVTPRIGLPVEIQALWYNALRTMDELCQSEDYAALAAKAQASFNQLFWNEPDGCLYDVVNGEERDASIRPNQVFAVSLTYPLVTGDRARRILDRVQRDLLTPFGLRSLAESDSRYIGRYEGGPAARDSAYHQGTVWSWLLGPFLTAYLRVNGYTQAAKQQVRIWLEPLQRHLSDAGLGQISEIFDGDPPHYPRGCIAQAWSVGTILQLLQTL